MSESRPCFTSPHPCYTADVLTNLLDRLCPPGPPAAAVRSLLSSLPPGAPEGQLRSAFEAASGAIVASTATQREELQALGGSVNAVSADLASALAEIEEAIRQTGAGTEKRQSLEEAVRAELEGLELVAGEVDDVPSLRRALTSTMRSVLGHLQEHSSEQSAQERAVFARLTGFQSRAEAMAAHLKEKGGQAAATASQQLVDPVTGCPNRVAFAERAGLEWAKWRAEGSLLTLTVFGLDRLVEINERFGHAAGDQVLRIIAKLATEQTPKAGLLCRHGGGEFVALLPGLDLPSALAVAEKIRATVAAFRFHNKGEAVLVTVSSGTARFRPGDAVDDAFEQAHGALRQARGRSGNLCLVAEGSA